MQLSVVYEREDRVDREDVEAHQFGRLVPKEPVEQFLALEEILHLEDDLRLVEFRKLFRHRFPLQMGDLGQPQFPVEVEPAGKEVAVDLLQAAVEM